MTRRKITELTELAVADSTDVLHIVDISEPIVTNQNKRITVQNLLASSTGGAASPLTTKGDLFTYSLEDARLPVGTDNQLLVANSATPSGLEWQTINFSDPYVTINSTGLAAVATGLLFLKCHAE